ncbi:MAG: hypothetical protein M1839_003854 [Geoglossum umbratile]|nr:MAG: hypothetical protein M1839_003854 [Geoglossum umbratile]
MPPSSFADPPLTPLPTDKKAFTNTRGQNFSLHKESTVGQSIGLDETSRYWGRYDCGGRSHQLVVRMPTGGHELFIDSVEDTIRYQLKTIRGGSDKAALFAQKVRPARSTEICFPVEDTPPTTKSKHEPDASLWHDDAQYPGVIIEVTYSVGMYIDCAAGCNGRKKVELMMI